MKPSSHLLVAANREAEGTRHNPNPSSFCLPPSALERGVALVVTVIMVAVITFLTIAFLVLTRREAASARTSTEQTVARLAAETALERAKAELLAPILAFTNPAAFDLRVSTNFINPHGFNTAELNDLGRNGSQLDPAVFYWATNVSYAYPNGAAVRPGTADFAQLMANLFYDPRPPVFIRTNRAQNPAELRYYLDLNRNGRFDTNGVQPEISWDRNNPFYRTNGTTMPTPLAGQTVSNFFVGDPEWIGMLERPEFPHSSSNRFTSRFAWIAIPAGKTLDLNTAHNDAKQLTMKAGNDGFLRNQGVGPQEINLGAFFTDLNTNEWNPPANFYRYNTSLTARNIGAGFDDASALLAYRYGGDFNNLANVQTLFRLPFPGAPFWNDMIDGYSAGPLMTDTIFPFRVDPDRTHRRDPWPGAPNPQHFFTTQDFFDPAKGSPAFFNRLSLVGTNISSYDRYTFYRLLSQLGTDSAPEDESKLNLNYVNIGGLRATNFVSWNDRDLLNGNVARGIPRFGVPGSVLFFTNAADRLLQASTREWLSNNPSAYVTAFRTNGPFGITRIPVMLGTNFVYNSSVQRLLQLAANMYEATTNSAFPAIYRPRFRRDGNDIFITGFDEAAYDLASALTTPLDLVSFPAVRSGFNDINDRSLPDTRTNIFGVPWVVAAKKGLPNFNQFASHSVVEITRKLEITRPTLSAPRSQWETNQMYVLSVSNSFGIDLWNSYRLAYSNVVDVYVTNFATMVLTNDWRLPVWRQDLLYGRHFVSNTWPGRGFSAEAAPASFIRYTNVIQFPPPAILRRTPIPHWQTNLYATFERRTRFPVPQLGLAVSNRVQAVITDRTSGRIIDYVNLSSVDTVRDLTADYSRPVTDAEMAELWNTNRVHGSTSTNDPTYGILAQICVSLGQCPAPWENYSLNPPGGRSRDLAIDYFRALFNLAPVRGNVGVVNTNLVQQVPFTPTRRFSYKRSLSANDPLVHHLASDLDLTRPVELADESLRAPVQVLTTSGRMSDRYQPWSGNPSRSVQRAPFGLEVKDPLIRSADDWDFPTNKFPNIGWLGRVHRGTPWQTVYMKSSPVSNDVWADWCANTNFDAVFTQPVNDRILFDLFTAALSDSASQGQMSINQSGLAGWSAIFGGVLAVTNALPDAAVTKDRNSPQPRYGSVVIEPAAEPFRRGETNNPLLTLVNGINQTRANPALFPGGAFTRLGDILAVPELTEKSPFLNQSTAQIQAGISDAAYERLPQQVMGLLSVGTPRFVIYGYGQTLRPADNSVISSGPFFGLCTNYQVTAEMGIRAVVRVDGAPANPRVAVESFNLLPPD